MIKIISFIFIILSFNSSYAQISSNSELKRDTVDLVLAMEICPEGQFSFCSNGYDQPFRGMPYLVNLNRDCFLNSYSGDVYTIVNPNIQFDTVKNNAFYKDSILNSYVGKDNIVSFYNKKFKKKVLNNFKRNRINANFDGMFYYALIHVKVTRIALGKQGILLPALFEKDPNILVKMNKCRVFYIDEVIFADFGN